MTLTFWLLLLRPSVAQTPADLAMKYGPPERERYGVAPGISLKVTYGRDHMGCRLVLKGGSTSPPEKGAEAESTFITSTLLDRVLNDLAPPDLRKGKAVRTLMQSGCLNFRSEDYDNVHIAIASNACHISQTEKILSLSVQWKRAACSNQVQPGTQATPK